MEEFRTVSGRIVTSTTSKKESKSDLKITKGKAEGDYPYPCALDGFKYYQGHVASDIGEFIAIVMGKTKDSQIANKNLICEAFNVANETGKIPRQLADENDKLRKQNKVLSENFEAAKLVIQDLINQNKEIREALKS